MSPLRLTSQMFKTQHSQMQSSTPPTQFLAGAWLLLSTGLLAFTDIILYPADTVLSGCLAITQHRSSSSPNSVGLCSPINDARETFCSTVALLDKIARRGLSSGDKVGLNSLKHLKKLCNVKIKNNHPSIDNL